MAGRWHTRLDNLGPEVRKTYQTRIESGFFDRYFSGPDILDVGFRGNNPNAVPIVPHAIGVDTDFPGYDGIRLPFGDGSQDTVHSSHCLEHIQDYKGALADWFRVLKVGGHLVVTVPHRWLYERKPTPTSRWGGNEHIRFYSAASLAAEVEEALPVGEYRIRLLRDNDDGFDYARTPDLPPSGCYELELVVQKIARPTYADSLVLSPRARAIVAIYQTFVESLLDRDDAAPLDAATLAAFGRSLPIPPYRVMQSLFPKVPRERLNRLLRPLVDGSVVDVDWYVGGHPDVKRWLADGGSDPRQHYETTGYFEWKQPNRFDPTYG
jgi:SAM-dependent methyltransferase